jgi:tetratricopeptide (TPR) repeat protein
MKPIKILLPLFILLILPLAVSAQDTGQISSEDAEATSLYIQGINAFENEDYELALDYLTEAYLKVPGSAGINFALADAYLMLGDLINASYYGKNAAELEPTNKWYHLKNAEIYRRAGKNSDTVESLQKALIHHPSDPEILYMLAAIHAEHGDFLKSNNVYNKIQEVRGASIEVYLQKFRNFNALSMSDSALVQLQQMRDLQPDNLNTLHLLSQYYMELNDFDSAMEILQEALSRNARDPQTLILIADIYINDSNWEGLGPVLTTLIEDPMVPPGQKLELARFLYIRHQSEPNDDDLKLQTESVLTTFSENEPDFGFAHLLAAEFFIQQNRLEEALVKIERATEVMPENDDAWRQRMQLLFSNQRHEDVIELSQEVNERVPDDAYIQFFVGVAYMLTDRHDEARKWLENATLAPAQRNFRSIVYSTLGDVLTELDTWEDAVSAYETALRLDSANHNAMNNYAYYLTLRMERLDYAKELSLKAISYEPENSAYLDTVGWVYFNTGDYENAKKYIQASIDTGDASAEVYEHLGDVYDKLGDSENAIIWWNKALELDSDRTYLKEKINP